MKSMYDKVLEKFLLQNKDKSRIRQFFSGAPMPAKMGYLKGYYKISITIIDGYYVECNSRGIEIARDAVEKYTWKQVADRIDLLIQQRRYENPPIPETGWEQMNLFDYEKPFPNFKKG